jgi:hypothetical protein
MRQRQRRPGVTNNLAAVIIDVILPCLNEAQALPWILGRMPADYRPIVVDNVHSAGASSARPVSRTSP